MQTEPTDKNPHAKQLQDILQKSSENRAPSAQYSPELQEQCVYDLVALTLHLPAHQEQLITTATHINNDLCQKGYYETAFRTAERILRESSKLPNLAMHCAEATRTLINSAMDAGEYSIAFSGIRDLATTGKQRCNQEMVDYGHAAMHAALKDCEQNPNPVKLEAAESAAYSIARDNHNYDYLNLIATIAKQQSYPRFAVQSYTAMAELMVKQNNSQRSTYRLNPSEPADEVCQLFLKPTEACNIYANPNDVETYVSSLMGVWHRVSSRMGPLIGNELQSRGYKALALSIANLPVDDDLLLVVYPRRVLVQKIADLASEALPQLQREMEEHKHLSPESVKLCIAVAHSCGLIQQVKEKWPQMPFDAKGLDAEPYLPLNMVFDSRQNNNIILPNIADATSSYPADDCYVNNIRKLCRYIPLGNPDENFITDTSSPSFKQALTKFADQFYEEAVTENMLRDFNRTTRPLIPEGYRSLGPGLRQRRERPPLKLAV